MRNEPSAFRLTHKEGPRRCPGPFHTAEPRAVRAPSCTARGGDYKARATPEKRGPPARPPSRHSTAGGRRRTERHGRGERRSEGEAGPGRAADRDRPRRPASGARVPSGSGAGAAPQAAVGPGPGPAAGGRPPGRRDSPGRGPAAGLPQPAGAEAALTGLAPPPPPVRASRIPHATAAGRLPAFRVALWSRGGHSAPLACRAARLEARGQADRGSELPGAAAGAVPAVPPGRSGRSPAPSAAAPDSPRPAGPRPSAVRRLRLLGPVLTTAPSSEAAVGRNCFPRPADPQPGSAPLCSQAFSPGRPRAVVAG